MVPAVASWEPDDRIAFADENRLDRVAEAFARVIDAKSPYTARHSEQVAHWAVAIAEQLDIDDAGLRDLGAPGCCTTSASWPSRTASSTSRAGLDPDELRRDPEHPRHTQAILARVACFRSIVHTAASHHERLDGSGYHRGLAAFDLTRPARVLAVADVYEALTAERPYRAAMPTEQALDIVRSERGTGLCPAAVDALERAVAAPPWTADLAQPVPEAPRIAPRVPSEQ